MISLISGGSCSGKSEFAERLTTALHKSGELYYIATLIAYDEESRQRVIRHRKQRQHRYFTTLECYVDLPSLEVERDCVILLDCITNLVANEMFSEGGAGAGAADRILEGVRRLAAKCRHLIIVSDEVFCDGNLYDETTTEYLRCLGKVNEQTARLADAVVEVTAGLPILRKNPANEEFTHALERI